MRKKSIAVMLATLASPTLSLAASHDELASAPRNAKCADRDGQGTEIVEVNTLFKCFGDREGFETALSGLAGSLGSHHKRAYGIVTFREGSYFARVEAPFTVSAPVFYQSQKTHYACVTVQHGSDADADNAAPEYWTGHAATSSVNEAPAMPESRLLAATLEADADADDDKKADAADDKKSDADADDDDALPLQARNPGGLRPPMAPPIGNTPAAMPEFQDKKADAESDKK